MAKAAGDNFWLEDGQPEFTSFFFAANPAGLGDETPSLWAQQSAALAAVVSPQSTAATLPTLTAKNATLNEGQSVAGSTLIGSIVNPANATTKEYAFTDAGTDGHLSLGGIALTAGKTYDLTAAQLAQLVYVAGSNTGVDKITIQSWDGLAWSAAAIATITIAAPAPAAVKAVPGALGQLANAGIEADVAKLMVNNSLGYASMLKILQDAAVGGMTSNEFSTLQSLASLLNKAGGISTTAYVQSIADSVIDGNGANAKWNGGSSTAVALGNLTATSSATQVGELIGEWFLGTDLPSANVSSIGETNLNSTYKMSTSPLYGKSGAPSYLDVNQGYDGDCYFLSSIAEVALKDPSGIESMITNNGNGTYGVRFIVDGKADYVTVNDALPNMPSGYNYANGSTLEFANGSILWPELLEKAYAELNAQPNAPHGAALNAASDSYAGIDAGGAYALTEITGQSVTGFNLAPSTSASTLASDNTKLAAAFSGGQELLVATSNKAAGNLVADHMIEVVGYNATSDMLTLHNPWGSGYSGPLAMTFNESLSALAGDNCSVYMTAGKAMA